MNIDIIFDLEATCWQKKQDRKQEIIEIGAVKLNGKGIQISEFDTFVQPTINPILSAYCTDLTSIVQDDVADAPFFPEALSDFVLWSGQNVRFWSWGAFDKNQLWKDCLHHDVSPGFLIESHYNLSAEFLNRTKIRRKMGVRKALRRIGENFTGSQHRGIDDARNIAKIFLAHRDWYLENGRHTEP